jgi:hypothetical protein
MMNDDGGEDTDGEDYHVVEDAGDDEDQARMVMMIAAPR